MPEIKSLKEFSDIIENLNISGNMFIYRGINNYSHELLPSVFRHKTKTTLDEIFDLEKKIIDRFTLRGIPFVEKGAHANDEWSKLFIMQHYGFPTRLLDWSENPYMALFFSLTGCEKDKTTKAIINDASFYILDVKKLNKKSIDKAIYEGEMLSCDDSLLNGHRPSNPITNMNRNPAAIYGYHNNQRIVAQRGVFTLFGSNISSMEKIVSSEGYPADTIIKYQIPKDKIESLFASLLKIGFTDSVVYPDLEGLALETKRFFGFEE